MCLRFLEFFDVCSVSRFPLCLRSCECLYRTHDVRILDTGGYLAFGQGTHRFYERSACGFVIPATLVTKSVELLSDAVECFLVSATYFYFRTSQLVGSLSASFGAEPAH